MRYKEKTIGILGGMGPLATVYLFRKIVELTPAKKDQDHLRIIIDNNPKIPDRTKSILNNDRTILFHLIETAKNLEKTGADIILIPCNTSHFYLEEIQKNIKVQIFNMIHNTIESVNNESTNIGLLATDGTLKQGLYQRYAKDKRINWIIPDKTGQKKTMDLIYRIKKGQKQQNLKLKFEKLLHSLKKKGAEYIILGCTELSLLKQSLNNKFNLIDPLEISAVEAIKFSRSNIENINGVRKLLT